MDMKFEVTVLPVADAERSKAFYQGLGWRLDADISVSENYRVVQFTPPGSPASIQFGTGISTMTPGSVRDLYLIVDDIAAARDELVSHGAEVSEVWHGPGLDNVERRAPGRDPDGGTYRSFATFPDPDGNTWLLQEITTRLPGRVDAAQTAFASTADLASGLRRAEAAHGEHEKRTGQRDANWPDWYAAYMVAEQAGTELPS